MKHRKRDPGSGISSSKSNISRAMRGRILKVPNFLAMRNQQLEASTVSHSEQPHNLFNKYHGHHTTIKIIGQDSP